MSYIKEVFKRSNIEDVWEFLMYGEESAEIKDARCQDYQEKLDKSYKTYKEVALANVSKSKKSKLSDTLDEFLTIHEEVYFKIGIQVGFYIANDMKSNLKNLDAMLGNPQNVKESVYKEI